MGREKKGEGGSCKEQQKRATESLYQKVIYIIKVPQNSALQFNIFNKIYIYTYKYLYARLLLVSMQP